MMSYISLEIGRAQNLKVGKVTVSEQCGIESKAAEKSMDEEIQRDQRSNANLATIIMYKELARKPAWREISVEGRICKAYWR